MREIKFRAWNTTSKVFSFGNWYLRPDGIAVTIDHDGEEDRGDMADHILMQYTGLKDKNGKEIYEGDILQGTDGRKSFIEYDAPHFILQHIDAKDSDFIAKKNFFGVIGNIYENPELISLEKENV